MLINGKNLKIDDVWAVSKGGVRVELCPEAAKKVKASRDFIESKIKKKEVVYGVNTGFGVLSDVHISDDKLVELQKNLVRSHAAGIGAPFSKEETRAMLLLRANALARGNSGCRVAVIEKLLEFLNNEVIPVIPCQGSLGASGDLAPLSHLALAIIGEGEVWDGDKVAETKNILKKKNITPLELQAKEGLAMINGCQVMTAVGLLSLYRARNVCWLLDLAGGISLEALKGSRKAFDPLISASRPHKGEAITAKNILKLIGEKSPIGESHIGCSRVQDAYSLRCMPQVHGATKDALRTAISVLEIEANASTDNPLVFADDDKILSCGNFHGMPVAHQMDFSAIVMTSLMSMSERRIEKLGNPSYSNLPIFLAPDSGLNSGHMIVQYAAASLVSESKVLSHPASVDSIPTNANKEDHVSMGTIAARKFLKIVRHAELICAKELLSGCQAIDFLKPLTLASVALDIYKEIRKEITFADKDRVFSKDILKLNEMIRSERLNQVIEKSIGKLEF